MPTALPAYYRDLVGWAHFFREQVSCRCGHPRGEHRADPLQRLLRFLRGEPDACTACPCRGFQARA